jgi:hypothetical protein
MSMLPLPTESRHRWYRALAVTLLVLQLSFGAWLTGQHRPIAYTVVSSLRVVLAIYVLYT